MSLFGICSITACVGLSEIARASNGDTILVSAAAGATGSAVCQIAMIKGLKVIGLTSQDEKCDYLQSLGVEAINYKKVVNLHDAIMEKTTGQGIDIYWDSAGGEILDIAIATCKKYARIVVCGRMSFF